MLFTIPKLFNKKKRTGPTQPRPNAKAYSPGKNDLSKEDDPQIKRFSISDKSVNERSLTNLQWYEILEVNPRTASMADVRKAFRKKISQCHPDKLAGVENSEVKRLEGLSVLINDAYAQAKKIVV